MTTTIFKLIPHTKMKTKRKRSALAFLFFLSGCSTPGDLISPFAPLLQCRSQAPSIDQVVGGKEVATSDPDYTMVIMLKIRRPDRESICTGTLISDRVVLTAAHCVSGVEPQDVVPYFITTQDCPVNQVREVPGNFVIKVMHKDFDGTPQSLADVALLFLQDSAPKEQQRLPLLNPGENLTNDRITLLGFGITQETNRDAQKLRRIYKSWQDDISSRDRSLVVDQTGSRGGFCRGDSGAPIIVEVFNEPHVAAVNSANVGIQPQTECQTMSIAMDIKHFHPWIEKNRMELEKMTWLGRLFSKSSFYR